MTPPSISVLTICGIDELPDQQARAVTHVLSLLDPAWPEIDAFQSYGAHHRTTLHFNDIIEPVVGKVMPTSDDVARILAFGANLGRSHDGSGQGHLLVHCHMGVSRSTAAMLSLLAQANARAAEDELFEHLRSIRPQAWPNSLMIGFADDHLDRGGRLTQALRRHYGHQIRRDPHFIEWMARLGRQREVEMAISD